MDKYWEIISKLQTKGVLFDYGMSPLEISEAEKRYDITFPVELKRLYSIGLPVSKGFYNWRDKNKENIQRIKNILQMPLQGLQFDLENGDFWCDKWGAKPIELKESQRILIKNYNNAPRMIPIYSHRYMPYIEGSTETPIFSIMQSDIIIYGKNLISYLEIEFGFKAYDIAQENIPHIKFWSDLL